MRTYQINGYKIKAFRLRKGLFLQSFRVFYAQVHGGSLASFLLTGLFFSSLDIRKNLIEVGTLSDNIVVNSDTISNKPFHSLYAGVDTNMLIATIIKLCMLDFDMLFLDR